MDGTSTSTDLHVLADEVGAIWTASGCARVLTLNFTTKAVPISRPWHALHAVSQMTTVGEHRCGRRLRSRRTSHPPEIAKLLPKTCSSLECRN